MPAQSDEAPLLGHSFLGTSFGRRELGNFVGSLTRVGFPDGSGGKESACNVGDPGSVPGSGRSPGGGHGNPLQCSCLETPRDGD